MGEKASVRRSMWVWSVWLVGAAIVVSLLLLLDWRVLESQLAGARYDFLAFAILLFLAESLAAALRLSVFADRRGCLRQAVTANAWLILYNIALPARLGDVVGVVVLNRYLGQTRVAAAMSILTQRLYDLIFIGAIFTVSAMLVGTDLGQETMILLGAAVVGLSILVQTRLELVLRGLSVGLLALGWARSGRVRKRVARIALKAYAWQRHRFKRLSRPRVLGTTAIKWLLNVCAIVLVLKALEPTIPVVESIAAGSAFVLLGSIPVKSIGGVGLGDAGLLGLLLLMGFDQASAAGGVVILRSVIVISQLTYWVLANMFDRVMRY